MKVRLRGGGKSRGQVGLVGGCSVLGTVRIQYKAIIGWQYKPPGTD